MERSKRLEVALLLVATLGVMSGVTVVSSLPLLSKTFSTIAHIEFLSKMMLTLPSIIIALFAPIAGMLVDKFGRLRPLYLGIILFIVGGSSGFYIENFYLILLGRAVLGFGVAFIMTSSMALIGDYFKEEKQRHKFMSKQGLAVALGGIIFITAGGFLAQIHWSYPFAIYLLPLLLLPFLWLTLYEPLQHKHEIAQEFSPKLFPVYITAFFVMVLFYMLPTQLPYLIINTLGGEPKTVGFVIATAMSFNALVAMQYSKIKARLSYIRIYSLTFLLFSIGLYLISNAQNITTLFFAAAPMGMAFGLMLVNTNAWFLSKVSHSQRAKASGILTSSLFLGQFTSPLLFEPIVAHYGIEELFFIISLVTIVLSATLLLKSLKH